jgi:hypothetical protein
VEERKVTQHLAYFFNKNVFPPNFCVCDSIFSIIMEF